MSAKKFETGQAVFLARWTLDGFCSEPATIQSVGRKYAVVTTASGNVVRVCLVYSRDAMKKSVAAIGLTANEAIATGETWNTQSKKDSMNALVSDVQNMLERADEAIDFLDKMKIVIQGGVWRQRMRLRQSSLSAIPLRRWLRMLLTYEKDFRHGRECFSSAL